LNEASEQELSEACGLLDPPEDRLEHLLPEATAAAAASSLQPRDPRAHQRHHHQVPAAGRVFLAMPRSPRSQVASDAPLLKGNEVRLVGKTSITRNLPRLLS